MAPTEGRVARPERRWGCRRGTPSQNNTIRYYVPVVSMPFVQRYRSIAPSDHLLP